MGTQKSWSRVWTGRSGGNPWGVVKGEHPLLISEVGLGGAHKANEKLSPSAPRDATWAQPAISESAWSDSA